MPKCKNKKAASKRFKVRKSGSIKHKRAGLRHILGVRSRKSKRHLRATKGLNPGDNAKVMGVLPYLR